MTTISHKRRQGWRPPPLTTLVVVLVIAVASLIAIFRPQVSALFWRVVSPAVMLRNALDYTESAALRSELASTSAALADRNALYEENLLLKRELGRDTTLHPLLAGVLMRPPTVPYDTLLIDAGSKDGVVKGDRVSAGGTTIIGVVAEVYDTTARVTLLSAPSETYQALLHLSNKTASVIPLAIEGQGAGSMKGEVPAGTPVVVGDSIEFPGIAGGFVGLVSHVDMQDGQSFETVYLQLPVNLFSLRFVEVLKPL